MNYVSFLEAVIPLATFSTLSSKSMRNLLSNENNIVEFTLKRMEFACEQTREALRATIAQAKMVMKGTQAELEAAQNDLKNKACPQHL